jgi:DNA-binding PadR family transcriptional regulator
LRLKNNNYIVFIIIPTDPQMEVGVTPTIPSDFEQQVLLAVWRLGEHAYGAAVREELEARTGRAVAPGAVYVTLIRLEKKGYLHSHLADPTPVRGGKAKRFFEIQPEGIAGVKAARAAMERLWEGLPESA